MLSAYRSTRTGKCVQSAKRTEILLAPGRETIGIALQTTQGVAYDGFLANRVLRNRSFALKRDFYKFFVVFL